MKEHTPGQDGGTQRTDDDLSSGAGSAARSDSTSHLTQNEGGTVDMGSQGFQEATGTSRNNTSGGDNATKRSVTGSDLDGQVG